MLLGRDGSSVDGSAVVLRKSLSEERRCAVKPHRALCSGERIRDARRGWNGARAARRGRDALGTRQLSVRRVPHQRCCAHDRRARPLRRGDRRSLEHGVAVGRHLGSRSDRGRERSRAGGADGRWHRDDSCRDDCARRTARARCRPHDEARSGAPRRRRSASSSGPSEWCRASTSPPPWPRRSSLRFVGPEARPCFRHRRANAKTKYPFSVSRRVNSPQVPDGSPPSLAPSDPTRVSV